MVLIFFLLKKSNCNKHSLDNLNLVQIYKFFFSLFTWLISDNDLSKVNFKTSFFLGNVRQKITKKWARPNMNLMFGHLFQSVSKRNFLFRFKIVTNLSNRNNRERPAIKKSNLECVKDPTPFIYLSKIVQMNVLSGGSVKHHNGSLEFYHRHRTFISFIHSFILVLSHHYIFFSSG